MTERRYLILIETDDAGFSAYAPDQPHHAPTLQLP
jgi:hypothetical protein